MISLINTLLEGPTEEIEQPYGKGKISYVPKAQYKKGDIFKFTLTYVSGKSIDRKVKIVHIERQSYLGPYTLWVLDPHYVSEVRPVEEDPKIQGIGFRTFKEVKQERKLTNIKTSIQ